MNTLQTSAVSPPARATDDAPTAEESLAAHARRALRARLCARTTAILDSGIALLQGLRKRAGGAQDAEADEAGPRSRQDRPRARREAAPPAAEAEAPRPKRRLRALLIQAALVLAGGLAGSTLAYTQLFQKQLDRQIAANRGLEAALAKKPQPGAETLKALGDELARRDQAEKKFTSALAEFSASRDNAYTRLKSLLGQQFAENQRLQAALAESARSSAETRQALEEAQARRTEAEAKLASSSAEYAAVSTEKQRQLDSAEKQLALLTREDTRSVQREAPPVRRSAGSRPRPSRSGDCALDAGNVGALKDCIDAFNR